MKRRTFKKLMTAYVITVLLAWVILIGLFTTFGPPEDTVAGVVLPVGIAVAFAFVFLMIGIGIFVFQDSRERGMESIPWTIVAVLVPYFIGFIAYLLVRRPLQVPCPSCAAKVVAEAAFCHQCGREMRYICPSCKKPMGRESRFCPHCGQQVESTEKT